MPVCESRETIGSPRWAAALPSTSPGTSALVGSATSSPSPLPQVSTLTRPIVDSSARSPPATATSTPSPRPCSCYNGPTASSCPTTGRGRRPDGALVDPFRPVVEPDGFADTDACTPTGPRTSPPSGRVRGSDVLVFTMGLTEAWRPVADGAVFAAAARRGAADLRTRRATSSSTSASTRYVTRCGGCASGSRSVNPALRILLTVSPVPLIATFEHRHVLVSTTASKSILRVAADEACASSTSSTTSPRTRSSAPPVQCATTSEMISARLPTKGWVT